MARTTVAQLEVLVTAQQALIRDMSSRLAKLEAAKPLSYRVLFTCHTGTQVLSRTVFDSPAAARAQVKASPPSRKVYASATVVPSTHTLGVSE